MRATPSSPATRPAPTGNHLACLGGTCSDGACVGCPPAKAVCVGKTVLQCLPDGSAYVTAFACDASQYCIEGACFACYPGERRCEDGVAEVCSLEGQWVEHDNCALLGEACAGGLCVSECLLDPKAW